MTYIYSGKLFLTLQYNVRSTKIFAAVHLYQQQMNICNKEVLDWQGTVYIVIGAVIVIRYHLHAGHLQLYT